MVGIVEDGRVALDLASLAMELCLDWVDTTELLAEATGDLMLEDSTIEERAEEVVGATADEVGARDWVDAAELLAGATDDLTLEDSTIEERAADVVGATAEEVGALDWDATDEEATVDLDEAGCVAWIDDDGWAGATEEVGALDWDEATLD